MSKLEDVTPFTGTLDLVGPRCAKLLSELGVGNFADMPLLSHKEVKLGQFTCRIVRQEIAGEPAATLIVPREYLANLWRELSERVRAVGGAPAGMEALNSVRLELGAPWFGVDYGDKQIPHEAGLEHSHINYAKGMLHRTGNRRAGPLARSRQPAAHGTAVFRRCGPASRNEPAVRGE